MVDPVTNMPIVILRDKEGQGLAPSGSVALLDDEVSALDVAAVAQTLEESPKHAILPYEGREKTYPIHPPRRLRLGGERRGEEGAS